MPPRKSTRDATKRRNVVKRSGAAVQRTTFVEAGSADPAARNRALAMKLLDALALEPITSMTWSDERLAWEVSLA